jgi:hypothetical protein
MKPCTCYKPGFWKRLLATIFFQRKPLCICENVRLPSKEEKRTSDLIEKPVRSTLTNNTTFKPVRRQSTPARPAARTQGGSMDTTTNDTANQMNLAAAMIIATAPSEPVASSSSSSSSNWASSSSDSYSSSSYDSSSSSF